MINNIFQLYILCLIGGLILMYLFLKINIDDTNFTKKGILSFIILYSILIVISYKYSGYYKTLINYALLIVLNFICFRRTILNSTIISTIVYIVYCIGDISAGITLMNLPNVDIVTIQSKPYFALLINILVFAYINIVIYLMKFIIDKVKLIKKDKETAILLMANSIIISLLLVVSMKIYEYLLRISNNVDNKYLNSQAVIILILLFSISLTILIFVNKYINNKHKYKDIVEVSKLDKMTDTLNREAGLNLLRNSIEERRINNNPITICYVDINNLKHINDTYGHQEGDNLIKQVTSVIIKNLRETDTIARLGGDEFLITFLDCKTSCAEGVLNRINEALKELSKESIYGISISHGFCEIDPRLNISIDYLIELADKEMYKLKRKFKEGLLEV